MSDEQIVEEPTLIPSILNSVKKNMGIMPSVTAFDSDLVLLINSSFSELNQIGVGPEETFAITDATQTWSDFYTNNDINMVREFVWLSVRLVFDPPTASVLTSMEKKLEKLIWRLNVADDEPIDRTIQNELEY